MALVVTYSEKKDIEKREWVHNSGTVTGMVNLHQAVKTVSDSIVHGSLWFFE